MNPKVPKPAAALMDAIASIEAPRGYDTVYGNKMSRMPRPLTSMTMKQVLDQGKWRTRNFGSSACGRYQFMDATLRTLATEMGLQASDVFSADYQDLLGYHLLKKRGYLKWARGEMSDHSFMIGLAKEWASFPVPYDMQGAHRRVKRGETYYSGDKLNHALIKPDRVETILKTARNMVNVNPTDTKDIDPPRDTNPRPADMPVGLWDAIVKAIAAYWAANQESKQ